MLLDQYNKIPEPSVEINTLQTIYYRFIGRFLVMPKKWIDSTIIIPIIIFIRSFQPDYKQGDIIEDHQKKWNFTNCIVLSVITLVLIGLLYFIVKSSSSLLSFLLLIPVLILTRVLRVLSS